jgi:hypothetical protein
VIIDWVCRVERVSSGWRLLRCDPIMIITELDLTNRRSQPLAAVTPMFNFMKQYSVFAMLAAAQLRLDVFHCPDLPHGYPTRPKNVLRARV